MKDPRFADIGWARRLTRRIADRIEARSAIALAFQPARLRAIRTADSRTPTGYISLLNPLPIQPEDVLGPYWPLLVANPLYVRWAHRRGRWVCPLDPDLHRRLGWYRRLGVDAVLTDNPAKTRALLAVE
jgi:glycerophosphoryl diester phosphodiesterase